MAENYKISDRHSTQYDTKICFIDASRGFLDSRD